MPSSYVFPLIHSSIHPSIWCVSDAHFDATAVVDLVEGQWISVSTPLRLWNPIIIEGMPMHTAIHHDGLTYAHTHAHREGWI